MSPGATALVVVGALGAGLVGGIFYAFSTFVMRALARLPGGGGMEAMQAINITVLNRWFLGAFFGTGVLCLGLSVAALGGLFTVAPGGSWALVTGSAVYLVGSIVVTMVGNVPLNEALAKVSAADSGGELLWQRYLSRWTRWNHLRTAASLGAAALLVLSIL